jgi:hypothetical protein
MNKRWPFAACILSLCSTFAWAQVTSSFSLAAVPTLDIPIGITLPGSDVALYGLGYGLTLRGEYAMPFAHSLSVGPVVDLSMEPLNSSTTSIKLLGGGGELAYTLYPIQRLGFRLGARGGIYGAFYEKETPFFQPYFAVSTDISYLITPSLNLGLGASYKAYLPLGEVYSGMGASLSLQYRLGAGRAVLKADPRLQSIFPLFYSYYDKNPVGSVGLSNVSSSEMRDLSMSFYVPQFMEQPKESWTSDSLASGARVDAPIFALFKDSIFSVTEGTKVAGELVVSYTYLGRAVKENLHVTVSINNRNGMTWDDTRKAAAFVTSMDTAVRGFSLPVAAMSRTRGSQAVNSAFRAAVAIFDALKVHGVGYVSDPVAPFETKSANKDAVDYLQFPVQTLAFKGGDCDDLSIAYAALLESAGIATAFITVPGHIYLAFDLGMGAEDAKGIFKDSGSFIVREGEAWLPVEVTRVQDGFVKAYQTGVQEWISASASGGAAFYPIREAWAQYPPANTGEIVKVAPAAPAEATVFAAYSAELQRFFIAEFQPRVDALKSDMAKLKNQGDLARRQNRLGVLYARFGMLDDARKQFEAIVSAKGEGIPQSVGMAALINLGNIAYLTGKYDKAFDYYGRALALQADNATALLGYARASYELGKSAETNSALQGLRKVAPAEAGKYAYMGVGGTSTGRAASAEKEVSSWSDED